MAEVGVDLECLLDEVVAADAEHLEDPDVVQVDLQVEALRKKRKKAAPIRANPDGLPISCGQLAGIVQKGLFLNGFSIFTSTLILNGIAIMFSDVKN